MEIRPARVEDALETANLFMRSFRFALPHVTLAHHDQAIRAWYREHLFREAEVWVAVENGIIVGFLALEDDMIQSLYLDPVVVRRGIGSQFIALAKQQRPGGLGLYAFQVNTQARAFYEHHGFSIVDFNNGERNEEHEPDVRYQWLPEPAQYSDQERQ